MKNIFNNLLKFHQSKVWSFELIGFFFQDCIADLNQQYAELQNVSEMGIDYLEFQNKILTTKFLKVRKTLKAEQEKDEQKLKLLSYACFNTTEYLEKLNRKGEYIMNMSNICSKLETEREKLSPYLLSVDRIIKEKYASPEQEFEEIQILQDREGLLNYTLDVNDIFE